MASTLAPLSPFPTPQQPVVDPVTGLMTPAWYRYFKRLDDHIREIEKRLDAGGL
jgi:hypothetical protein